MSHPLVLHHCWHRRRRQRPHDSGRPSNQDLFRRRVSFDSCTSTVILIHPVSIVICFLPQMSFVLRFEVSIPFGVLIPDLLEFKLFEFQSGYVVL